MQIFNNLQYRLIALSEGVSLVTLINPSPVESAAATRRDATYRAIRLLLSFLSPLHVLSVRFRGHVYSHFSRYLYVLFSPSPVSSTLLSFPRVEHHLPDRNPRTMIDSRWPRPTIPVDWFSLLFICSVVYFLGFIICRQIISGTAITTYIFSSITRITQSHTFLHPHR